MCGVPKIKAKMDVAEQTITSKKNEREKSNLSKIK